MARDEHKIMKMRTRVDSEHGTTLVELLTVMAIMSAVSVMILTTWFALNRSYVNSVNSNRYRDDTRTAMTRMEMEIRDAESSGSGALPTIRTASSTMIEFTTTFNMAGNTSPSVVPRLVRYYLAVNPDDPSGRKAIFRKVDGSNGAPPNGSVVDEPAQLVVANVVNMEMKADGTGTVNPFTYYAFDQDGVLQPYSTVLADTRNRIQTVEIRLQVDSNPSRSPTYMDFETSAQPRNMRQS